jgi:hypothetical protein
MTSHAPTQLEFIERVRRHLVGELAKTYGLLDLPQLAIAAEGVEELVKAELLRVFVEESPILFRARPALAEKCIVAENGIEYHIRLAEDVRDFRALLASVTPIPERPKPKFQKISAVKCKETGRFKLVRLYIATTCPCDVDLLQQAVATVLDTAYSWFRGRTEDLVAARVDLLARDLYAYLRTMIPNDVARQNVWFASVTTDWGFRLLAPDVARAAFAIIDKHAPKYGYSTNRLVAEVLTTALPRDKLLMQQAVRENKCIDANLKDAKYRKEGSIYASALAALYGGDSFTVYPVTANNKISVVLLFPTTQRAEFESLLTDHLADLQRRCEDALSPIRRTLATLREKKQAMQLGQLGELIGGITKGLFGS